MNTSTLHLEELYTSEQARLRSFVRRLVGNPSTAEDLVQQAFANLLAKGENAGSQNPAYVARAVRNLAINYLRDTRRKSEIELSDDILESIADGHPTPEMVTIYRSELQRLLRAILELPVRRRTAFALNRIEGLSYDEIALRMGISRNTVISQVVAALAELNQKLS